MEIRELKNSDLNNLLELYLHLHGQDDPSPGQMRLDEIWQEIQTNPRLKYFGLFADDKLVSSCTISIIPNLTRGGRPYGLIENVVTHQDFRRKGYGKAILSHATAYAWSLNCYKVMLLTGRKSEVTFRFYTAAGFDMNEKQAFIARPGKM